jgi:hypothetical protein
MDLEESKLLGVVDEIGLERDDAQFTNFNLMVGIRLKTEKKLSYNEGERLIKQLRKDLLGKNIEFEAISLPCPICGKSYNTEQGLKTHIRRTHEQEKPQPKEEKLENKKKISTKKKRSRTKTAKK